MAQGGSLQWHGSYAASHMSGPAGPMHVPGQQAAAQPLQNDDFAAKVAELAVLRSRLQQYERENARLQNEVVAARELGPVNEKVRERKAEAERLQRELHLAKQDLLSSEDERKRLFLSLQQAESLASEANAQVQQLLRQAHEVRAPEAAAAGSLSLAGPAQGGALVPRSLAASQSFPAVPTRKEEESHWCREALLLELGAWQGATSSTSSGQSSMADWHALREAITLTFSSTSDRTGAKLSDRGVEEAAARLLRAAAEVYRTACGNFPLFEKLPEIERRLRWKSLSAGARFVRLWTGLLPAREIQHACLYEALAGGLHAAVLHGDRGPSTEEEAALRRECAGSLLQALTEAAARCKPTELAVFGDVFLSASLCGLLVEEPSPESLHTLVLQLLRILLQSSELFALVHQTESDHNPLLAAANLLSIPSIQPFLGQATSQDAMRDVGEEVSIQSEDTVDHQQSRLAALELFCRCLATAPQPEVVFQLRGVQPKGEEEIDTVLQRVLLLCHHELLCLALTQSEASPWVDADFGETLRRRWRCVELCLTLLCSFVWQKVNWAQDLQGSSNREKCSAALSLLGRTRPLLPSVTELLSQLASGPCCSNLQSSLSTLQALVVCTSDQL